MPRSITRTLLRVVLAAGLAAPALIGDASAQKAKDTLRIALNEFVPGLNPYNLTLDELSRIYRQIYRPLMAKNEHTGEWVPQLARSWKRIDDTTVEIELRDDITFHSGNKLSADDVVYIINFVMDPATRIPGKARFSYLKGVEKTGPLTVRITTQGVVGTVFENIAYELPILDSRKHAEIKDNAAYGRVSASSAGHYRLVSMDPRKGALLERFDKFIGDAKSHRAPIRFIQLLPIPDKQTQMAELMTGGVDVLRNPEPDMVAALSSHPDIAITRVPSGEFIYILLDAAGRSGQKPLTDVRVRRAVAMAIDRHQIGRTLVSGGEHEKPLDAICMPTTTACSYTNKPPAFDPAAARKLLVEAGYANGFQIGLQVHTPMRQVGEAIASQLQKVGIRTSIEMMPISVYTRKRGDGQLSLFVGSRPTTTMPEATAVLISLFGGTRDYARDPVIKSAIEQASRTFDAAERARIIQKALDHNNEQVLVLPIAVLPTVLAHHKSVRVERNLLSANDIEISDFFWR